MRPCIDTTVDGHVHTRLCHHARGEMEDYVRAAIHRGLAKIFFLEHLETRISYFESTWLSDQDFDYYFQEGARLKKKYQDRLEIGLGVEVGYNPDCPAEILARIAARSWDRIAVSYHFMAHQGVHLNMVSSQEANIRALDRLGLDRVITTYFKDLKEAVENLPGQVLCHFDAVLRHHPDIRLGSRHHELISALLEAVARKKMAVEINTSGYRLRGEPYPALDLIKETVRRGIPLVAGSDAHKPEDVGRFFHRLADLEKSIKSWR